jgi:hypothetical protein
MKEKFKRFKKTNNHAIFEGLIMGYYIHVLGYSTIIILHNCVGKEEIFTFYRLILVITILFVSMGAVLGAMLLPLSERGVD